MTSTCLVENIWRKSISLVEFHKWFVCPPQLKPLSFNNLRDVPYSGIVLAFNIYMKKGGMMNLKGFLGAIILLPILMGKIPQTDIEIGGGYGSYIYNDGCSRYRTRYREIGISLRQKGEHNMVCGTQGTIIDDPEGWEWDGYGSLFIGYDNEKCGAIEVGILPYLHLRFGPLRGPYLSMGLFDGIPLYSGAGWLNIGMGGRLLSRNYIWLGLNAGPFENGGILVRTKIELKPWLFLNLKGRYGKDEEEPEYAGSAGLTFRLKGR